MDKEGKIFGIAMLLCGFIMGFIVGYYIHTPKGETNAEVIESTEVLQETESVSELVVEIPETEASVQPVEEIEQPHGVGRGGLIDRSHDHDSSEFDPTHLVNDDRYITITVEDGESLYVGNEMVFSGYVKSWADEEIVFYVGDVTYDGQPCGTGDLKILEPGSETDQYYIHISIDTLVNKLGVTGDNFDINKFHWKYEVQVGNDLNKVYTIEI